MKYPVLTVTNATLEVEANNEMKLVLDSVTSKPVSQTYYPSINSGYLEYKLNPSATKIEIRGLAFATDEAVVYTNMTLTGAITVSTITDGILQQELSMDIEAKANRTYSLHKSSDNTPQLPDTTFRSTTRYTHALYVSRYNKKMRLYYYYPPEFSIVSVYSSIASSQYTYEIHTESGLVIFERNNVYNNNMGSFALNLSSSGVAPGTYVTPSNIVLEAEQYDGTIRSITIAPQSVQILDPSTIPNKITLRGANNEYNPNISPDFYIK
ncbi:MAG: hypothetical protein LBO09_00085 [Candidatus Peribacteria bacterium]|nr:hypothetical protein [Candidatus Peribacteria bacterium]